MRKNRFATSALVGVCLVALTGFAPQVRAQSATAQIRPLEAGMARVWFMRPSSDSIYNVGADPIIYANGTSVGEIAANTDFFRDLRPGTYKFSVHGTTTGQSTTLQLTAGTQTYLEVEWAPQWNYGYDVGAGFGPTNQAFAVFPVTPQVAQAYLPTLTYRPNES
jgi:hypothetical protein